MSLKSRLTSFLFGTLIAISVMMKVAFAGDIAFAGDTDIFLKNGTRINVKTSSDYAVIRRFNKAGRVTSVVRNKAKGRKQHRALVAQLSNGAVRIVRHHN